MYAWVTLLTQPDYLVGVKALHRSLKQSNTRWPLVVMATEAIPQADRAALQAEGCVVQQVDPIYPNRELEQHYASAQFGEVWTKLRAWQLTAYERVVFLDADMLVLRNMDELFTLDFGDNQLAACHACRCNPNQIASYPASWQPENCHYTWQDRNQPAPASLDNYLNGGFLVLKPDNAVYEQLADRIAAIEDLKAYPFSEQDLLNEAFAGRWQPLPYIYNALKTLPFQHSRMWNAREVKNLHYILAKPWKRDLQQPESERDRYYALDKLWWEKATG
ncbi:MULTISPECIES: glycosyltransferase family 8 protein [Pantoea]|jgi:alpha-N-acetylglucosamine transferase|uniref:glycosyltransferase family 8 protein n=1 Tax=Pantoea TaxID=53335 RepID=UPI000EA235E6|nr:MULTISPECIES: glycosyltransferase family 8 protein [Pantoea]MBZ6388452.1 glycosyltransferase family 8 protein [Pantoea piersonii]MBZ6402126.1 glycosyltransferase family 8 protein [Pantoea piersonii]MBZ6410424.1 glycosyltransferase family 8 protein [Pantoea piersonii]MBZ6428487.1 glycosyltransferase family 8 protein [Pantoea piersonii]NYB00849.1 glycosyltransferase family 8 protein [Pantoea piersonii]